MWIYHKQALSCVVALSLHFWRVGLLPYLYNICILNGYSLLALLHDAWLLGCCLGSTALSGPLQNGHGSCLCSKIAPHSMQTLWPQGTRKALGGLSKHMIHSDTLAVLEVLRWKLKNMHMSCYMRNPFVIISCGNIKLSLNHTTPISEYS